MLAIASLLAGFFSRAASNNFKSESTMPRRRLARNFPDYPAA
jgi:hypothetical protein